MWWLLLAGASAAFTNSSEWLILHYNECEKPEVKHFQGETLAYVTPWNGEGWRLALTYAKKIDYIVPVWHQLSLADDGVVEIAGEGNTTWTGEIVTRNPRIKVVPRVILEKTSKSAYRRLLNSDEAIASLASELTGFAKSHNYPGLTLEVWVPGTALISLNTVDEDLSLHIRMIERIGKVFKRAGLLLILPVPPPRTYQNNEFDSGVFLRLSDFVHRFSVMSYDFSTTMAGPNSPLVWFEGIIEFLMSKFDAEEMEESEAEAKYYSLTRKLMMGIPFYGYKFTPVAKDDSRKMKTHDATPIIWSEYLDILNDYQPKLEWNERFDEHTFSYMQEKSKIEVFYPTQTMLHSRVSLAHHMGVGLSVWELGQGLDIFFELL